VAEKPHDAVVKFDTYRNLQLHRAFLIAIARHLVHELTNK